MSAAIETFYKRRLTTELLALELTSDNPRLLPRPQRRRQRLTHDDDDYMATHLDSIAGDSTDDEGDTPF